MHRPPIFILIFIVAAALSLVSVSAVAQLEILQCDSSNGLTTQSRTLSQIASAAQELPSCINSAEAMARVQNQLRTAAHTSHKYDVHRALLQNSSPQEILGRLIYAETLAANCPQQNAHVVTVVASVIGNRLRQRNGDVPGVVFERDQFASSLNSYRESRLHEFFCPQNLELWQQAHAAAASALRNQSLNPQAYHYYLYSHSSRFTPPAWARGTGLNFSGSEAVRSCIRVFARTS